MANTTGTHSYSTALSLDPAGGSSYAAVAEVIEITHDGVEVKDTDMSNLQSPTAYREFRPGMADAKTLTFKLTFTQGQYATLLSNIRTKLMSWKVTLPLVGSQVTAATLTFAGHINKLGKSIPEDDRITNDVGVKISGAITFTAGS